MFKDLKYCSTPSYGIITSDGKKFSDCALFKNESWKYCVLKSLKIWWGTPKKKEDDMNSKTMLGIIATYKNIMTGKDVESQAHVGEIVSSDIIVKDITLEPNDYFDHFYIGFNPYIITFIKFTSKNGKVIELGKEVKGEIKRIKINEGNESNMIQCLYGFYNSNRIMSLGCKYIKRKDYSIINNINIFRIRHLFHINKAEKEKWNNKNLQNKSNIYIKALAKTCLLPESLFYNVIKYCV